MISTIIISRIGKVLLTVLLILYASPVFAVNLGTVGTTYEIVEKDALIALQEKAKQVNWNKVFSREKTEKLIKEYRPKGLVSLPRAEKDSAFHVDMTYTLDFDIPDGKGGILYPKGYTFNPLEYVQMPTILVVIDGDDPEQVAWFKQSRYNKDLKTMLLLVEGSYAEVAKKLDRPVFYADKRIINKFNLKAVPAIVYQDGVFMKVEEVALCSSDF